MQAAGSEPGGWQGFRHPVQTHQLSLRLLVSGEVDIRWDGQDTHGRAGPGVPACGCAAGPAPALTAAQMWPGRAVFAGRAEPRIRCKIRKTPGESPGWSSPGDGEEDGRCCRDVAAPLHPWDPRSRETRGGRQCIPVPGSSRLLLGLLGTPRPSRNGCPEDATARDGISDEPTASAGIGVGQAGSYRGISHWL